MSAQEQPRALPTIQSTHETLAGFRRLWVRHAPGGDEGKSGSRMWRSGTRKWANWAPLVAV